MMSGPEFQEKNYTSGYFRATGPFYALSNPCDSANQIYLFINLSPLACRIRHNSTIGCQLSAALLPIIRCVSSCEVQVRQARMHLQRPYRIQ